MAIREGQRVTAADYLEEARRAVVSRDGITGPRPSKLREAEVYARLAQAEALDRIAAALEALAAEETAGVTVQPAVGHSA